MRDERNRQPQRDAAAQSFSKSPSTGYEEDFEADDEGPADDADARENTSSSPQSQMKKRNISETEDDGNDGE